MPPIRWSRAALIDVGRLHDFLVDRNPEAARRAVQAIRQGVKILKRFPQAGRTVDYLLPEDREWIIEFGKSAYVVYYRYDEAEVVILAVRHGRESGL